MHVLLHISLHQSLTGSYIHYSDYQLASSAAGIELQFLF